MNKLSLAAIFICLIASSPIHSLVSRHCTTLDNIREFQSSAWSARTLREVFDQSNLIIEQDDLGITKQIAWGSDDSVMKAVNVKRILIGDRDDEVQVRQYIDMLYTLIDRQGVVRFISCAEGIAIKSEIKRCGKRRKLDGDEIKVVYLFTEPYIANFDDNIVYQSLLPYFHTKSEAYRTGVYLRMAKTINNLHLMDIIHGSVEPRNFKSNNISMNQVRIAGFEWSGHKDDPFKGKPTIFNSGQFATDFPVLSVQHDVYGFGMTLAVMEISKHLIAKVAKNLSKKTRIDYLSKLRQFIVFNLNRVKRFRKTLQFKDSFALIVGDCLSPYPVERPSMESIIKRLSDVTKILKFNSKTKRYSRNESHLETQTPIEIQQHKEIAEIHESKITATELQSDHVVSALSTVEAEKESNKVVV
jgi:hypothetical protein